MKKILSILVLIAVGVVLYSFTANDRNPENVPERPDITNETTAYIKTIVNNELNVHIQKNFVRFFDKVEYVEARFSDDVGYFYAVFGEKKGEPSIQFIKVEKNDIDNETYTYFDFEGFTATEFTEYCYKGGFCVGCEYQPSVPCLVICGPWPTACD